MHRKKPFSNKKKKKQLQDRRRRKEASASAHGSEWGSDSHHSSDNESVESSQETTRPVGKGDKSVRDWDKKEDPFRYRLQFYRESNEEIRIQKELAMKPFSRLGQESLELDINDIYRADTDLDIPKRPAWTYQQSKAKLEANEHRYFKAYLDRMYSKHDPAELSYMELNLETWRQLWRVLEISEVLLLIADIRYPSLHISPPLYKYITEDLGKAVILILNKIDLAPPPLVVAWKHYLKQNFPLASVVCFTSFPKECSVSEKSAWQKRKRKGKMAKAMGPRELYEACSTVVGGEVDLSSWAEKISEDQTDTEVSGVTVEDVMDPEAQDHPYEDHVQYKDGVLTIGCIGYPNVGKSAVLNALMGKKVVSVSRTPGHTKHFQTIFLTPTVRLCDCPGLVLPSLVSKNLQILAGMYPISQVREPYTTVGFIAQRLDLPKLLHLVHPNAKGDHPEAGKEEEWSAFDICDAWADKRGFVTAKASRLDTYRAANSLLRMVLEGRLCLCFTPPGYTSQLAHWESQQETLQLSASIQRQQDPLSENPEPDSGSEDEDSDWDEEGEEMDEDEQQGGQLIRDVAPKAVKTSNPFALLADDD